MTNRWHDSIVTALQTKYTTMPILTGTSSGRCSFRNLHYVDVSNMLKIVPMLPALLL